MTTTKRRARRIAADEAHAWARNLRLGNVHAKLILSMLTLYVDSEGKAFVAIPSLAEDCELSPDTVRRRLGWLDEIGAISRVKQWLDEKGNRNGDGRGKQTTDLIQLLYESDTELIEARAAGVDPETPAKTTVISPSWQPGLNADQDSVRTRLGLGQPSHCGQGLISEPEPEPETPLSPQGDASEGSADQGQQEPEHFGPAYEAWPAGAKRRDLALDEFLELSPEKQRLCRAAIPYHLEALKKLGRTGVPNFHVWIRSRGFDDYPLATIDQQTAAPPSAVRFNVAGTEGRAIKALYEFARTPLFENHGTIGYPLPVTAQVLKFGDLPPPSAWHWIEERQQLAAWSAFLSTHIHRPRPDLLTTRTVDGEQRRGMLVPWPWPPRKDGTISEDQQGAA